MKSLRSLLPIGAVLVGILLLSGMAVAQSGRKGVVTPRTHPLPTPGIQRQQAAEERASISPVVVVGRIIHPYAYLKSSYLDSALKECVNTLQMHSVDAAKGEKLELEKAKELAEKERRNTVLWIGFVMKDDGFGNMRFDEVEYAVLLPRTARFLTSGTIKPGTLSPAITSGGVLRLPRQGGSGSINRQMKIAASEIVNRLRLGGWIPKP